MASKQFNSVDGYSIGNATVVVDANANITAAALTANGNVSFTGANVSLGSNSNVKLTGGSSGQYLQTDGTGNLSWQAVSVSAASISNGNSNVNIPAANGNIQVSVAGTSNVITFTSNNAYRGSYGLTGFVYQANTAPSSPQPGDQWYNTFNGILFEYLDDGTTAQWVDISTIPLPNIATVNASAVLNNVQTSGTYYPAFISSTANGNYQLNSNTAFSANLANGGFTATTFVGALSGAATTAGTVTTAAQPNITSVGTLTSLSVTGNVSGGNLTTDGKVVAVGNVEAAYFIGNGSQLTGIDATAIQNGTANVRTFNNANVTVSASGNANVLVVTGTGANIAGTANVSGNLSANNITTGSGSGGNISGANVISANTFTASANITAANFIGNFANGNSDVNIPAANGNINFDVAGTANVVVITATGVNVAGTLRSTGNANVGNIGATNANVTAITATGNANVGNLGAATGIFTTAANVPLVQNGTSNVAIASGANVTLGVAGTTRITATSTGANVTGTLGVSGNANVGNIGGATGIFTTAANTPLVQNGTSNVTIASGGNISMFVAGNATARAIFTSTGANIAGTANITGNANVGNLGTDGLVVATGNVSGGNLTTTGVLSVTGTGVSSIAGNLDMTSNTIINLATPTNSTDAATKQYVDDVAQGLNIHDSCQAATPDTLAIITSGTVTYNNGASGVGANLTTTGTFNLIDGVNVQTSGTRILVKNEANAVHNGIYTWSNATVITRATDYNSVPEVEAGDFVFVTAGTLYDNTGWVQTSTVTAIGTAGNNIDFAQFSGAGTYTAGTGLTLTGSQFSVNASQTQVTSVGTLTGLNSSGTITAPAFTANTGVFTGNGSGLSAIAGANVTGTVSSATSATTAGTVTTAAQPNITSTGTLTGLTVSGTTSLSTASGYVSVGGTSQFNSFKYNQDSGALGSTVGNQVRHATYYSSSTNADYLEITNTRYANGGDWTTAGSRLQQKIDATWMGFIQFNGAVQGGITFGTGLSSTAPNAVAGKTVMDSNGHFYPLTDNSLTLGASGQRWSTAFATTVQTTALTTGANSTAGTVTGNWTLTAGSRWQATYADLAEKYAADDTYEPGTVLLFGGEQEVTLSNAFDSTKVAGVVTTNPAYSMNAMLEAEYVAEIALQGRVPCKVIGPIEKGDLMVSANNGHATANNEARAGTIIGKALENFNGDFGIIEVAVGRF
jgi:hypothetical protein